MPHTARGKAAKTNCVSYELKDVQQQPAAAPVINIRGSKALAHKLPSGQKHAEGRSLPPAPVTATKQVPQQPQQVPGTSATPLTDPDTLSGSTEPGISSGVSAQGTVVSSDDDASSYEPSSREQASPDTAETGPVARPSLHPKSFSKHGHNILQRHISTPRALADAAKPGSHHESRAAPVLQVLQPSLHCHFDSCHHPGCRLVMYTHVFSLGV